MKKILFILTSALFITACQKDEGGGAGAPVTTAAVSTPLSRSCIDGTTYCNNQVYGQYAGWMPYPGMYGYAYNYSTRFQNGFCGCPIGYQPVYNNSYGLGCVQASLLGQYSGYFQTWTWSTGATGWGYAYDYPYSAPQTNTNMPQFSNIPAAKGGCWETVTQSCFVSEPNYCGTGATCRPVMGNSNLGVCVNH